MEQLIMLFHGEQAINQFKEEVPAAVYYLPWRNDGDKVITAEDSDKQRQNNKINFAELIKFELKHK